jgi:hypothetical protein
MATDVGRTRGTAATTAPGWRGGARRLTTETKHALKTTEFWAFLAVLAGILIASAVIGDDDAGGAAGGGGDEFGARSAWLYVAILTVGYMVSRGLAKSGSHEPYWEGGTNAREDGTDRDRV